MTPVCGGSNVSTPFGSQEHKDIVSCGKEDNELQ